MDYLIDASLAAQSRRPHQTLGVRTWRRPRSVSSALLGAPVSVRTNIAAWDGTRRNKTGRGLLRKKEAIY